MSFCHLTSYHTSLNLAPSNVTTSIIPGVFYNPRDVFCPEKTVIKIDGKGYKVVYY